MNMHSSLRLDILGGLASGDFGVENLLDIHVVVFPHDSGSDKLVRMVGKLSF